MAYFPLSDIVLFLLFLIHSPFPPLPLPLPLILSGRLPPGSRQWESRVVVIIVVVVVVVIIVGEKKDCIGRESNPGRPRSAHVLNGRRAFYH